MKKSLSWKHITLISCCLVLAFVALMAVAILVPVGVMEEASASIVSTPLRGKAYNPSSFRYTSVSNAYEVYDTNSVGIEQVAYNAGLHVFHGYGASNPVVQSNSIFGNFVRVRGNGSTYSGFFVDFYGGDFDSALNGSSLATELDSLLCNFIAWSTSGSTIICLKGCYRSSSGSAGSWVSNSTSQISVKGLDQSGISVLIPVSSGVPVLSDHYYRFFIRCTTNNFLGCSFAILSNSNMEARPSWSEYNSGIYNNDGSSVDPSEPSPYDSWFGVSKPNAIVNNSDFYYVPVSEPALPSSLPSSALYDRWTMDAVDRRGFAYQEAMKAMRVYFNTFGSFESVTLKYRYRPVPGRSYLFTLSADFSQLDSFSVTLSSGLEGVSYFTETIDTLNEDTMLYSIACPAEYTSVGDMLIIIEMNGPQSVPAGIYTYSYLYFSKLESDTTFFTGYEYPSHDESYVVKANYMTNYDFADPVYNDGDITRRNQWFVVPDAYSSAIITIQDIVGGGRSVSATNNAADNDYRFTLRYVATSDYITDPNPNPYLFTLYAHSDSTFYVTVYSNNLSRNVLAASAFYPSSTSYFKELCSVWCYGLTSDFADGLIFEITMPVGGTISLYNSKLEIGYQFTGFVYSVADLQANYDAGYDAGFSAGSEAFSSRVVNISFNDVSSLNRIEQGYSELFGMTLDDLTDFSGSFTSGFYTDNDYAMSVSGMVRLTDSSNHVIGFMLYGSRFTDFDITAEPFSNGVALLFYEHYTQCFIDDPAYPVDWNPVLYPNYRSFTVRIQFGFNEFVSQINSTAYADGERAGYLNGLADGKIAGIQQGYNEGVEAREIASWQNFVFAFVDMPVKVLTGLLDFEFFGFNMFNIVKIFVFVAVLLLFVRLLIKGKMVA